MFLIGRIAGTTSWEPKLAKVCADGGGVERSGRSELSLRVVPRSSVEPHDFQLEWSWDVHFDNMCRNEKTQNNVNSTTFIKSLEHGCAAVERRSARLGME